MWRVIVLMLMIGARLVPSAAADPVVFGTGHVRTSGTFSCFNIAECSASGNTVTLGAGDDLVRLTFAGVDASFPLSNTTVPLTLGTITSSAAGDRFPSAINANIPFVRLNFLLAQDDPAGATGRLGLGFGPGGGASLGFMQGGTYMVLPAPGNVPSGYRSVVYSLSPSVFSIPLNGSFALTANVGVVPEPSTMILTATGLLIGWYGRRRATRRSRATGGDAEGAPGNGPLGNA